MPPCRDLAFFFACILEYGRVILLIGFFFPGVAQLMTKEQVKKKIEETIYSWIGRIDELIAGVKGIRNYREDNMCVDYHRSLVRFRNEYYNLLLKLDELTEEQIKNGQFDKMTQEADKRYKGVKDTLDYLKTRRPIIKWD